MSWYAHSNHNRGNNRRGIIISLVVAVLLVGSGVGGYAWYKASRLKPAAKPASSRQTAETPAVAQNQPSKVRLVAIGENLAHTAINARADKGDGSYDYTPMLANIKPLLTKADVRLCHQSVPAGGPKFVISGHPIFNAPTEFTAALEDAGCNAFAAASNHTNDKGQQLIDAFVSYFDDHKNVVAIEGANRSAEEQNRVRYFTSNDIKFSLLAYTTFSNNKQLTPHGVNMFREELVQAHLKEARANADIVIVSMCWGKENSPAITDEQAKISQQLADLGADIIVGTCPHVLQPVKKLAGKDGRETIVWYSLGNFLHAQLETDSLFNGMAVMDIDVATKKVSNLGFLPTYMHYEWTPAEKAKQDLLKRQNFGLYTLDQAAEPLLKSQNKTTPDAQRERITKVLNEFTPIPILHDNEY